MMKMREKVFSIEENNKRSNAYTIWDRNDKNQNVFLNAFQYLTFPKAF